MSNAKRSFTFLFLASIWIFEFQVIKFPLFPYYWISIISTFYILFVLCMCLQPRLACLPYVSSYRMYYYGAGMYVHPTTSTYYYSYSPLKTENSAISNLHSTLSTSHTVYGSSVVFTSRRYNAFVGRTPLSLLLLQLSLDEDTLLTRKSYLIGFQLCRFFLLFAVLQGDFTREEIRICQKSRWEQ